jgi:hypothetical protein
MRRPLRLAWILPVTLALAVAAGVVVGVYFAGQLTDGSTAAQEGAEKLFPSPAPVPASAQLPVEAADIQVGPDGKLFVADRGDGCPLSEVMRKTFEGREWVLLGNPSCSLYWRYAPDTGEVAPVPVVRGISESEAESPPPYQGTPPIFPPLPTPKPGAIAVPPAYYQLGPDGKYFRADAGDGCVYQEVSRYVDQGQEWVLLQSPTCADILFSPTTGDIRNLLSTPTLPVTPEPTPAPTPLSMSVPRRDIPSSSEVQQDADGKYFIPDRGDGCGWREHSRYPVLGGTVTEVMLHPQCAADVVLVYRPETGELLVSVQ